MLNLAGTFALLSLGLLAQTDAVKEELKLLEGEWQVVGIESDGSKLPPDLLKSFTLTFKGTSFATKKVEKVDGKDREVQTEGTFKIDPTKSTKWIDISRAANDVEPAKTYYALYKLDGDKLTICQTRLADSKRPESLAPRKKIGIIILTLQRVKR